MGASSADRVDDTGSDPHRARLGRRDFLSLAGLGALSLGTLGLASACADDRPASTAATPNPQARLYYGASTPRDNLQPFEQQLGTTLPCYRSYFGAGEEAALVAGAAADLEAGRLPITSIKPSQPWAAAADDIGWIEGLVGPLGDLDHELYLCVHHEPENDSDAFGGPDDYRRLQRSLIARAAALAPRLTVVPILSTWSFDERSNRLPTAWNVPDAAVYGVDLYNPWSPTNGKAWVPFADKLGLARSAAFGRPLVVGEYGCRTDPRRPGRAATWMRDAFDVAVADGVVAMSYFNSHHNSPDGTWELDAERMPVFAELMASPEVARI